MASEIWSSTTQIMREETRCNNFVDYSFRSAARDLLYDALFYRQVSKYAGFATIVVEHWLNVTTHRDRSE